MAKEAKTSRKSRFSEPTQSPSKRMVLRVRTEATKRFGFQEETRVISTKKSKSKSKQDKKQSKNIDANKPKKPPTAFFYFLEDFRKDFKEKNPDVKSMRDIGKACGEKWRSMTYEEKVQYYDIAAEKRAEFDTAIAEYTKRKESGEDEESEDESEFDQ